ncbi:hypothetical protein [Acetobacter sp.]|uniref:hypothetical protein n=1 Tax=Acetobacter sp. TaxID=440 RepID=UPI0039EA6B6C
MTTLSAEAFLKPRLEALVAEAEKAGYAQDVTIALLISLLDTETFAPAPQAASTQGEQA